MTSQENELYPPLKARVDMARMEVYRHFIEEKSATSIYLESILNTFVALVQTPVNFAIFNQSGQCLFHFCTDKEHKFFFEKKLLAGRQWNKKNTFDLFPHVLEHKYKIAIVSMHSKFSESKSKFTPITPTYVNKDPQSIDYYICRCGLEFFSKNWFEFNTFFSDQFGKSIRSSIEKITENHRWEEGIYGYPPDNKMVFNLVDETTVPNKDVNAWNKVISNIFKSAFRDSDFGYETLSRISHKKPNEKNKEAPLTKLSQPTNMLVAYRSFTRKKDDYRHSNENGGYPYNTFFLVPDTGESAGSYGNFFNSLKIIGKNSYEIKGHKRYCNLFEKPTKKKKYLTKEKFSLFKKIAQIVDDEFWKTLESGDGLGVKKILKILSSPAGKHVRHLVDPVYSTGLIHINSLFDLWGLDRFDQTVFDQDFEIFSDVNEDVKIDLLRTVSLYYFLHGAASWDHPFSEDYNPETLSAFLIPVKMRGAVWAVTIHAFYDSEADSKLDKNWNPTWMSRFLLSTVSLNKNQVIFDQILWENLKDRVTNLLIKYIGSSDIENFVDSIEYRVNEDLEGEKLLLPYALPYFSISKNNKNDEDSKEHIIINNGNGDSIRISWEPKENNFFVARQPWDKKGTRSFKDSVDLGVNKGIDIMFALINKKEASTYDKE